MGMLLGLVWWAFVLGASFQAWKAWGGASALGCVLGLYLIWALLPWGLGGLLTVGAAVAIGARAEGAQQRQLVQIGR
ncbi:MAG TPA: hypothetical protein PKA64_06055 [Myxococcota bacterium]|nr:hypothetical protein [Myxococcota bacterium]